METNWLTDSARRALLDNLKDKSPVFAENALTFIHQQWSKPHRVYHSLENHLIPMLEKIEDDHDLLWPDKQALNLTAIFHDLIYEINVAPVYKNAVKADSPHYHVPDNEQASIFWLNHFIDPTYEYMEMIRGIIAFTGQYADPSQSIYKDFLALKGLSKYTNLLDAFAQLDLDVLLTGDEERLKEYERQIRLEYVEVSTEHYKNGRYNFLLQLRDNCIYLTDSKDKIDYLCNLVLKY